MPRKTTTAAPKSGSELTNLWHKGKKENKENKKEYTNSEVNNMDAGSYKCQLVKVTFGGVWFFRTWVILCDIRKKEDFTGYLISDVCNFEREMDVKVLQWQMQKLGIDLDDVAEASDSVDIYQDLLEEDCCALIKVTKTYNEEKDVTYTNSQLVKKITVPEDDLFEIADALKGPDAGDEDGQDIEAMTRVELKLAIKELDSDFKAKKAMTDADLRNTLRELEAITRDDDDDDEDDNFTPAESKIQDELSGMNRKELKEYKVAHGLEFKVKKAMSDQDIMDAIINELPPF